MITIKKHALVLHNKEKMFTLVDRVEDYPNFLPWCSKTQVIKRSEKITKATILINYHNIKQSFTTENVKIFPTKMNINLVDGPFKTLKGEWSFIEIEKDITVNAFKTKLCSLKISGTIAPYHLSFSQTKLENTN